MDKGERLRGESVFAALYLRGIGAPGLADVLGLKSVGFTDFGGGVGTLGSKKPGLNAVRESGWLVRRWPRIESVLRSESPGLGEVATVLRRSGLWDEAAILEEPGRLAMGEAVVEAGLCLTVYSEGYPAKWRRVLGSGAPPAVWCWGRGGVGSEGVGGGVGDKRSVLMGDMMAVVGGRSVSDVHLSWALAVGSAVAAVGQGFVSGGAVGVDRAALRGYVLGGVGGVEILPCGIGHRLSGRGGRRGDGEVLGDGRWLSVCGWDDGFTTAGAMERNALIYAMAERAVVVGPRWKTGGTWHGATDALRRRLCRIYVALDGSDGVKAIVGLGARGLRVVGNVQEMAEMWRAVCMSDDGGWGGGQPDLFGATIVREGGCAEWGGVGGRDGLGMAGLGRCEAKIDAGYRRWDGRLTG